MLPPMFAWFENVVDLGSGRRAAIALAMPGRSASEQLGFACRSLGRRVVRLGAPLFVPAARGADEDAAIDGFARAARRLRSRGLPPSLLGAALPLVGGVDGRALDRFAALGVRVCLDAEASSIALEDGGEARELSRRRQIPLCVSGVSSFDALMEAVRGGASWVRGPALSGSAREPRSLGEPQRRLVDFARARATSSGPADTVAARLFAARDSIRATTRALERSREGDLCAMLAGVDHRLRDASTALSAARTTRDAARAGVRSASLRLDALLDDLARGDPPSADRLLDAIDGMDEARTLDDLSARAYDAEVHHGESLHASALLRVQASLAALSARTRLGGAASLAAVPMAEPSPRKASDAPQPAGRESVAGW